MAVRGIGYRDGNSKWLNFELKSPCCNSDLGKNINLQNAKNLARDFRNIPFNHFVCTRCDKNLPATPAIKDSKFAFMLTSSEDNTEVLTSWVEEFTHIGYMESLILADEALRAIIPTAEAWQEGFKNFYLEGEIYHKGIALDNNKTSLRILVG